MTSGFQKTWMKQAKEATKNRRGWTRSFQKVITRYEYVVDLENLVSFWNLEGLNVLILIECVFCRLTAVFCT